MRNDKTGRPLFIDAYFPNSRLAVEYNGPQHYEEVLMYANPNDTLEDRQYRDKLKFKLLRQHNIIPMAIKYTDDISKKALTKRLSKKALI